MPIVVAIFRKRKPAAAGVFGQAFSRGPVARNTCQQQAHILQIAVEEHGVGCGQQQHETLENGIFGERLRPGGIYRLLRNQHGCRAEDLRGRDVVPGRCRQLRERVAEGEERKFALRSTVCGERVA